MTPEWKRGNRLWVVIPIVFLLASAAGCQSNQPPDKTDTAPADRPQAPGQTGADTQGELYLGGEPGAPVRIEVFSDYQCPRCKEFYLDTIKPIIANYAGTQKLCVVYHDLPLEMHLFARPAARLALAAARIGREEWLRLTDELYKNQEQWAANGNFDPVLAKALSPTQLLRVIRTASDPAIDLAIQQEILLAQSRNITSTPTFFITVKNGREQRINGAIAYTVLKEYIDRLLSQ